MSEQQTEQPAATANDAAKKDEAVKVLSEILGKMGLSGSYDVKDATDGSISIAMTLSGELPGAAPGKRSHVVDSIQFLINKIVNRTPQNRRWISLGLGEHPAPRQPKPTREQNKPQPAPSQPAAQASESPQPAKPPQQQPPRREREQKQQQPQQPSRREQQVDEASLEVADDPALTSAAKELAERAAKHGRIMAVIGMSAEDRARLVKAAKQVAGVSVKVEGEGRNRRVSLVPDKPTPMPKQNLPVYDDEEEDEE